jgi:hypothetical protein
MPERGRVGVLELGQPFRLFLQNVPRIDRKIATFGAIFIKCGRAMFASGEKKYYLANLPAKTGLRTLAAITKARWIREQAHQQLRNSVSSTSRDVPNCRSARTTAAEPLSI